MFAVRQEGDKVILDLGARRCDLLMSCGQAERFEHALRAAADAAELAPPELVRGEAWEVKVESYDGLVAVRFLAPFVGAPSRVPVPAAAARALADEVSFKRGQAAYRMRFRFKN